MSKATIILEDNIFMNVYNRYGIEYNHQYVFEWENCSLMAYEKNIL
jgi:hypothetical protein